MKKSFILSCFLAVSAVFAQKTHTVVKGDNPYNIAKKYGMSLDELLDMNPKAKAGVLNIGDVLKIKGSKNIQTIASVPADSGKLGKIVLKPKQTIYGITKQYHISETDLRKLNPDLDANMKIGNQITLPLAKIQKYGDEETSGNNTQNVQTVVEKSETDSPRVVDANSYEVQEKDNYFKIGRKFGLSQQQLFALNPGLEEKGLHPGDVIVVKGSLTTNENSEPVKSKPVSTSTENSEKTRYTRISVEDDYVTYTVQSGDTVFGIINKFGVTLDALLELNPDLVNGLKTGMVLKIKKKDVSYVKKSGDALNVVLMLPFGFDSNDSKYRTLSADFLTGAKLALERNVGNGLKMDVRVIDAGNEASFKDALTQINTENTDLIIGPFFKSNILDVLDFVSKDKIPVVAPFANSADLYPYSNLIIVETNEETYADKIVKEVKEVYSDQKIYIVADADQKNANYLKQNLEKELANSQIILVSSPANIQVDQNMMTGQSAPVIAILANDKDSVGEAFGNKMIALGKEVSGIRAFSMFYAPIFEKKTDELSQVNLVYLMDRKINTDGTFEKEILAEFKKKYCKTPSKYNVIGFDVMNDMLSRENKRGEIFKQMNKSQTQLATKFEFERVQNNGAYINKGYRVVRLVP